MTQNKFFIELQTLHIFCVMTGLVRAKTRGGGGGQTTKGNNRRIAKYHNSLHFGQTLNGESLK